MKIIIKILKYFLVISINVILLFGLKMIVPVDDDNNKSNSLKQNVYIEER